MGSGIILFDAVRDKDIKGAVASIEKAPPSLSKILKIL
jgi:hypothetical protein